MYSIELISRISNKGGIYFFDLHYTDNNESKNKIIQPLILLERINVFSVLDTDSSIIFNPIASSRQDERIPIMDLIEKDRYFECFAARMLAQTFDKPYLCFNNSDRVEEVAREFRNRMEIFLRRFGNKERFF